MSTANIRLINAVKLLRELQADGFSLDAIVAIALDKRLTPGDRPADEHPVIVQLYREAIGEAPRRPTLTIVERVPVNPNAAVFANFVARWPDPVAGDERTSASAEWRHLSAAEQADAINGIENWRSWRCQRGYWAGPANVYLRNRAWKRLPAVNPAFPPAERTSA